MRRSLSRLLGQAKKLEFFDAIHCFDEYNLPVDFKESFKDKLLHGSRGFGYWSWKSVVISKVLSEISDGDCMLYIDSGCHINPSGKNRLIEYFELLEKSEKGIIAFQANTPNPNNSKLDYDGRPLFEQPNYRWIKGDLFDYFKARNERDITDAQVIGAGVILLRKCEFSKKIVEEWRSITLNRFDLTDDTPSVSPNLPGFIEHRHDQSLWTLLCLKYKVETLSAYEYWYPIKTFSGRLVLAPDWKSLVHFPIHAKRDLDFGVIKNITRYLIHKSMKIKRKFN